MKRMTALLLALLTFSVFAQQDQKLANGHWAYYGQEFYSTLSANKKITRESLSKIFNEKHSSNKGKYDTVASQCTNANECYSHTTVGYERARKIMFGELDTQRDSKGTYVVDVYCGKKFYFRSLDEVNDMHTIVNIEHTWPQSRFNKSIPKEIQKSDMHHLYLTDSYANNVRGNSPFGFLEMNMDLIGGEGCRSSRFGFIDDATVYTPPAGHQGNVARSLFYFAMHYNLPITQKEEQTLRQWHKADPIDAAEIRRHELIAKHQNIRNPFVDHPEIVDMVSDF